MIRLLHLATLVQFQIKFQNVPKNVWHKIIAFPAQFVSFLLITFCCLPNLKGLKFTHFKVTGPFNFKVDLFMTSFYVETNWYITESKIIVDNHASRDFLLEFILFTIKVNLSIKLHSMLMYFEPVLVMTLNKNLSDEETVSIDKE